MAGWADVAASCPALRSVAQTWAKCCASPSAAWPLPDTPAIAAISPAWSESDAPSRRAEARSPCIVTRSITQTASPRECGFVTGGGIARPTMTSASADFVVSRAAIVATSRPARSTAMRSDTRSTSSSLWLMKITDSPSATMPRSVANSASLSCGVSTAMGWPQSVALQDELQLAKLVERTRVHTGLLIALALAGLAWGVLRLTTFGFEVRAVGANARAARFAGVPVTRTILAVALASGAVAGLAGAIEVAGRTGYVTLDMSPGYGYSGIVIAMLAALNPLGVVAAAIFVAGILVGADSMSRAVAVPTYIADVIVAVSLITMLIATLLTQYKIRWRHG